jgi:hypothetical protein
MKVETDEDIARAVQDYLDRHQPANFKLSVVREAIRQDDDWWYVTVVPIPPSVRSFDYASILTDVEDKIRQQIGVNLLLVPTLAAD